MDYLLNYTLDLDESTLKLMNRKDGIRDYLDSLNKAEGKLYITPKGPFSVLKEAVAAFSTYRKTILRRFNSKRSSLAEWYVITGDTPLQPDEICCHCDKVDDILFGLGCWMTKVHHKHGTPLKDSDIIEYLIRGDSYDTTYIGLNSYNLNTRKLPHL